MSRNSNINVQSLQEEDDLQRTFRIGIYAKINPELDDAVREVGLRVFGKHRGYLKETLKEALLVWLAIQPYRTQLFTSEHSENLVEIVQNLLATYFSTRDTTNE